MGVLGPRAAAMALWALVASGPLLGGAALLAGGSELPPPAAPRPAPGLLPFAELVVHAHMVAAEPDVLPPRLRPVRESTVVAARDHEGPDPGQTPPLTAAGPHVVAAVDADPADPGRWGVTVMALTRELTVQTWQVTVAETAAGPVLEAPPALVGTGPGGRLPALAAGSPTLPDADDPLRQTVEGFLVALLTGDPTVTRWTTADADVSLVAAGEVDDVELTALASQQLGPGRAAVLAHVQLVSDGRARPAHYPLLVVQRDRWEVAALLPAMPLARPAPAAGTEPAQVLPHPSPDTSRRTP